MDSPSQVSAERERKNEIPPFFWVMISVIESTTKLHGRQIHFMEKYRI